MNIFWIGISLLVGLLLGGVYFAGLWFTVSRISKTANPGLWMLASFAMRASLLLLGIYAFTNGQWEGILACLAGFLVARTVWVSRTRASTELQMNPDLRENIGSIGASPSKDGELK